MRFGGFMLTAYAIWGKGNFARFLRGTFAELSTLFIEFMLIFWIWTWAPLFMTFAIPIVYVTGYLGLAAIASHRAAVRLEKQKAAFATHIAKELSEGKL